MDYIGNKIMNYRKHAGLTIREFAELTKLSPSLLSQLERGIGNPSLTVLEAIAEAMGISLANLFLKDINTKSLILRKSERTYTYNPEHTHIIYNTLTPVSTKNSLELFLCVLKPKAETMNDFIEHPKEEVALILKGEAEAIIEDEKFILYEGDTVRILPERKHKFRNCTNKEVEILFTRIASE